MTTFILAIVILLSAGIWLTIVFYYDRVEPESLEQILWVGFWGGFYSVACAAILNEGYFKLSGLYPSLPHMYWLEALSLAVFIGCSEEISKAAVTWALTTRHQRLREPIDAMIYAMTVSLGFAIIENIVYVIRFGLGVIVLRMLLTMPAHLSFASFWGFGYAKIRFACPSQSRFRVFLPYLIAGITTHAAFDFFLFLRTWTAGLTLPLLVFLIYNADRKLNFMVGKKSLMEPGECQQCCAHNQKNAEKCAVCGNLLH